MMSNLQPRERAWEGVVPQCRIFISTFEGVEREVYRFDCFITRMGWPFVAMRRRTMKAVVVMMLIVIEIAEEVQQDWRQVRFRLAGGAFSRKASSSPWIDASSDEEAS